MTGYQGIGGKLAQYFCSLNYEDLSDSLISKIKAYFLDWIGSAIAGSTEPPTQIMASLASETQTAVPQATIIPTGSKHLALLSALVNGASSHVKEMDDLHRPSIFHPGAPIIPAALAPAEKMHSSGRQLILAILTGYEVGIRTALAVGKTHYDMWHTTATCGTFGAAAAAAKAMELDQQEFAWALGSAGTQAAGLWQFLTDGAMSKQLHTGKAAFNGLLAALLAQRGLTGPTRIFEGEKGFLKATSRDYDISPLIKNLGHVFLTEQNSLKYYASCGHTHTAIQAALSLRDQLPSGNEGIEGITVYLYKHAIDLLSNVIPHTPYLAKFHVPFCVATALCYGDVGLGAFSERRLKDKNINALLPLISLREDTRLTPLYPEKWPARVEIRLSDGKILNAVSHHCKGDPENPLTEGELIRKFRALCGSHISEQGQEDLVNLVLNLEKLDDITRIFHGIKIH